MSQPRFYYNLFRIHFAAIAYLVARYEIFVGGKLEQSRLENAIIYLAFFVKNFFVGIRREYPAHEIVKMLQLVIAVRFALDGNFGVVYYPIV